MAKSSQSRESLVLGRWMLNYPEEVFTWENLKVKLTKSCSFMIKNVKSKKISFERRKPETNNRS